MRALVFGFIGLAAFASVSHSGEVQLLETPPLMRQARIIPLPYISGRVLFRPNGRVFVSASQVDGKRNTATIWAYNAEDTSQLFQFDLPHTVEAMTFSEKGDWLFLVGGRDREGYASRVHLSGGNAAPAPPVTVKMSKRPVQPSVAVDSRQTLYVSDATSSRLITLDPLAFDSDAKSQDLQSTKPENQLSSLATGVHALAISEMLNLAFISSEALPKISAIRLDGTNRIVDELLRPGAKGNAYSDIPVPQALLMTTGVMTQDGRPTASLLIGDHPSLTLTIADFDPMFRTMNIAATAPVRIRINPNSALQIDAVTNLVKQPFIIGSDDKQSTIVVGDVYSTQLVQLSRGAHGVTLERVGEIEILGAPTSISVSSDGGAVVVAMANSPELRVFTPSTAVSIPNDQKAKVRQLQRELSSLGLELGSIDGILGPGTSTALNVFNKTTGSNVSLNDIDAALHAVASFRSGCPTSGLGCLVNNQLKTQQK
jgi:DNA-binding beta-propeller fold protein YncE